MYIKIDFNKNFTVSELPPDIFFEIKKIDVKYPKINVSA